MKIGKILETMLPVLQHGGYKQQQLLTKQVVSIVRWCFKTERNAVAYRVTLWLINNGMLDISLKLTCLRILKTFAGRLEEEDYATQWTGKLSMGEC